MLDCSADDGGSGGGGGGTGGTGGTGSSPVTETYGDGAPTPDDPVHVRIESPQGPVSISVAQGKGQLDGELFRLGTAVAISAPDASPNDPMEFTFTIDRAALWAGAQPESVVVERDGTILGDCTSTTGAADPDPCVAERALDGGDLVIVVRTSQASTWTFGVLATPCVSGAVSFTDVAADGVHATDVGCLAALGIARGTTTDEFDPGAQVTRGQMAGFIARALRELGVELPDGTDQFTDDGGVFEDDINSLAAAGVVRGISGTEYQPELPVTREQTAALLTRTVEFLTGDALQPDGDRFQDDDGSYFEEQINAAAAAGLVNGFDPERFEPRFTTTRGQIASLIVRMLDLGVKHALSS